MTAGPFEAEEAGALSIRGVTRTFGELTAVDDVSLTVPEGELRAIIGPNGAGKTTLFSIIAGTLAPDEGDILLFGADVTNQPTEERVHDGLARSYQSNQLFQNLTAIENVRIAVQTAQIGDFTFDFLSGRTSQYRDRAHEILNTVGLSNHSNMTAANLSHGDQRKLAIAIALATDPSVLLLDEPTSGMGPEVTKRTANLINDVQEEYGLTVLMIEHDMDVVIDISDRISVLERGSLLATDKPDPIRENEAVQEAYLGGHKEMEEL